MLGRSKHWSWALALLIWAALASPTSAQSNADADKLNTEVIRLYQAGKYAEAVPVAQQMLALYETALGPEHPDVATSLNNLALLYGSQGRYAEAEPLYKRTTLLLIATKDLELGLRETLLKLNAIARHRQLPRSAHTSADHDGAMKAYNVA